MLTLCQIKWRSLSELVGNPLLLPEIVGETGEFMEPEPESKNADREGTPLWRRITPVQKTLMAVPSLHHPSLAMEGT